MNVEGSSRPLYQQATRAALLGLVINLLLGIAKLLGGIFGHSFALLSDAVNSLGDTLTSVVVLFALRFAQRPADQEHPYGHTRAEAIAASNLALLIVLSAVWVGWEAVTRMGQVHEIPVWWTLWIAGANVLIKESLYRYKVRIGRQTGSAAIIANAWDHRSDALCSLAVLIGLIAVRSAGPEYLWVDELAALVVAAAIIYSGVQLFRSSASELMDLQAGDEFVLHLRTAAEQVPGVRAVEKLRVRKTGLEYLADMHLEVDAQMTVAEGHRIGHAVKDQLIRQFPALRDVLIHLEPHSWVRAHLRH